MCTKRIMERTALTDRSLASTAQTCAEGAHASLALIAVVLLARAQSGAFDRTPSAWIVLTLCTLIWAIAAAATRFSPPTRAFWFASWRSCVSPTLITLIAGGRGTVGLLLAEMAVIAFGIVAVGYFAYQSSRSLTSSLVPASTASTPEALATNAISEPVSTVPSLHPEPTAAASPIPDTPPLPESIAEEPDHVAESGILQRLDSAHEEAAWHLKSHQPVTEEESTDEKSAETESWTRREFEGEVSIEAVVLARFAEGAKLAVLHLPFVPPLPEVPQIEYEPLDSGCDVTISTESAFRHGARLHVTRRSTGPAEAVPIGIVIYTYVEEEIES